MTVEPPLDLEADVQTEPVTQRDLVVMGASAGGVTALQTVIAGLPPEFPASVLVVLHLMTSGTSVLDQILARAGTLPVSSAVDGEQLERGHVYVAPPDHHLLVRDGAIHVSSGPRENGHRPAIDPLFRSAARARGSRVIGVVLSGTLDDGTDGLRMIKERGGATVVQDPNDAAYGEMPRSALDHVGPDYVASAEEIPEVLYALVDALIEPTDEGEPPPQRADLVEVEFGREPPEGEASLLTCPDCGGVLLERDEGPIVRFACQVGHAYSPESLVEEQGQALESALWSAQRTLEERADLLRRMARRARRARGFDRPGDTADRFERRAEAVTAQADVVRNTILRLRQVENGHDAAIGAVE